MKALSKHQYPVMDDTRYNILDSGYTTVEY